MKSLKEFLETRIVKAGFHGTMDFLRDVNITWPTFDLATSDPERSRSSTRELIAESLKFRDWSDLEDAWKSDDVRRGLPEPTPRFGPPVRPSPVKAKIRNALNEIVGARPETVKSVLNELDEGVLESIRELFSSGRQGTGREIRQAAKPKQP